MTDRALGRGRLGTLYRTFRPPTHPHWEFHELFSTWRIGDDTAHMNRVTVEHLRRRADVLHAQYKAAPDREKWRALIDWHRAVVEIADAVLRRSVPPDGKK